MPHQKFMEHIRVLVSCCIGLIIFPFSVLAAEWSMVPNVQLQGGYDDNIRLATGAHEGVRSGTFSPSVALTRRTPLSSTAMRARLKFTRYSGDELRDTNVQRLSFSSRYREQRASWNLNGVFKRDTTLTTITEPDDPIIDEVQDIDEGLIRVSVRRNQLNLEPSWKRDLTERVSVKLKYRVRDVYYSNAGNTGLVDYQRKDLSATLKQRVTEKDQVSVITQFEEYTAPDAGTETDSNRLMLAIDHDFVQSTHGNVSIGRRKSSSVTAGTQENDSKDVVYRMGLMRKHSDLTSYRVLLERGLASSGVGRAVESYRINIRVNKKIAPLLNMSVRGDAFRNEALEGESASVDRTYYKVDLSLRRTITRDWFIKAAYRYRWQKREDEQLSADSNALFVTIDYKHKMGI